MQAKALAKAIGTVFDSALTKLKDSMPAQQHQAAQAGQGAAAGAAQQGAPASSSVEYFAPILAKMEPNAAARLLMDHSELLGFSRSWRLIDTTASDIFCQHVAAPNHMGSILKALPTKAGMISSPNAALRCNPRILSISTAPPDQPQTMKVSLPPMQKNRTTAPALGANPAKTKARSIKQQIMECELCKRPA